MSSASLVWVKYLRNESFFVTDPQLYNSIPATLRKLENGRFSEK